MEEEDDLDLTPLNSGNGLTAVETAQFAVGGNSFNPAAYLAEPAEGEDDRIEVDGEGKKRVVMPSEQEYWRTYASWLACWPSVADARNDMALFAKDWEALSESAACFVVVHRSALRVRKSASSREEDCTSKYLRPGQCFAVAETLEKEGINYLKLGDGSGWVFDRLDESAVVVAVDAVELGEWWYTISTSDFVEVRSAPSNSDGCRSGWIMCPKEVTVVGLRCNIGAHRFLQLQDGRGWLFENSGALGSESQMPLLDVMRECSAEQLQTLSDEERVSYHGGEKAPDFRTFTCDMFPDQSEQRAENTQEPEPPTKRGSSGFSCFALCGRSPAVAP